MDQILEQDLSSPKKQRHTAKRIYERLRDEHGFPGKYTIVKDYVREGNYILDSHRTPWYHLPVRRWNYGTWQSDGQHL